MYIGIIITQILTLKTQIEINLCLRKDREKEIKKNIERLQLEKEESISELPEWAEEFIDNYMANSEKNNRQ